ncbi:hypothetical protein BaRGS_00025152, partial [Batillaria attramentaria]
FAATVLATRRKFCDAIIHALPIDVTQFADVNTSAVVSSATDAHVLADTVFKRAPALAENAVGVACLCDVDHQRHYEKTRHQQ